MVHRYQRDLSRRPDGVAICRRHADEASNMPELVKQVLCDTSAPADPVPHHLGPSRPLI